MSKQFSASVVIEGIDKASAPIRNITNALEGLAKTEAFTRLGNVWGNVTNRMGNVNREVGLLSARFAGLGLATAGIFGAFIKPAAEMENLRFRLNNLYGDATKAKKVFSFIQDFAIASPYSFETVTESLLTMKNMNFDNLDKFKDVMNYMGAHVPDQEKAKLVMVQLAQAWGKGMLMMDDIRPIQNSVNILGTLSKVTGKNIQQLMEMSKKHQITRKEMLMTFTQWGKESSGSSKGVLGLWDTKISNLGDVWVKFADKVMNTPLANMSLFGTMKSDLDKLQGFMNDGFAGSGGKQVAQTLLDIYSVAKDVGKAFMDITPALLSTWNGFKNLTGGTKNALYTLGAFMALPAVASIAQLGIAFGGLASTFMGWAASADLVFESQFALMVLFETMTGPIGIVTTALVGVGAAGILIAKNWDAVTNTFANLWTKWGGVMRIVAPPIALLVDAAEVITKNWQNISDTFSLIWKNIGDGCHRMINAVHNDFARLFPMFDQLGNIAQKMFPANNNMFTGQQSWALAPAMTRMNGGMAPPIKFGSRATGGGGQNKPKKDTLQVAMKVDVLNGMSSITSVKSSGDSDLRFIGDMGWMVGG